MELINTDDRLVIDGINNIHLEVITKDGEKMKISFELKNAIDSSMGITSNYAETFDCRHKCVYHCLNNNELLIKVKAKKINYSVYCGE